LNADLGVDALRLLALDLGALRIGLAVSDPEGKIVVPAGHIQRTKLAEDIRRVLNAAGERRVEGVVVGIPYSLNGETGTQAKRALVFAKALRKQTSLPVHETDESYTSVEAEALMREAGQQPSRERAAVDEAAAVLILKRFLDGRTD
tara:strand:- start:738 stop:1178 length:441 start_codon:yes stop_codon:yes gene_type:complete